LNYLQEEKTSDAAGRFNVNYFTAALKKAARNIDQFHLKLIFLKMPPQ